MKACNVCGHQTVSGLIDLGRQSVCHHFLRQPNDEDRAYHLALGQCGACGSVQLTERIPIENLKPRFNWLKCTEPEDHLDRLAVTLCALPGIDKDSRFAGISFKDDSVLERLKNKGYDHIWRADPRRDLGVNDPIIGFQSVQEHFLRSTAEAVVEINGLADVFIARHIIEHAYDFREFMAASKKMLKPGGYVLFEIPDCRKAFEHLDYTTVWEEHMVYFTEETFKNSFAVNGFSLVHFEHIPYSSEDSYVGIARVDPSAGSQGMASQVLGEEIRRAQKFAREFPARKEQIRRYLKEQKHRYGPIALFGGGHMSCVFLNLFDLGDVIDFVVDDNPHMRGLRMPGSKRPVLESKALYDRDVKMCLLTLSPQSEEKVIKKNQAFIDRGGVFGSVFPGSKWAIHIEAEV